MVLKSLDSIFEKSLKNKPKRLVIVIAEDLHLLEAIAFATKKEIISPILIGNVERINELSEKISFDIRYFEKIHIPDPALAAKAAVSIIKEDNADILMKGLIPTATFLKAILDNKQGITCGNLLSHIAICQISGYHKLLALTDAAINIKPDLNDKMKILINAVKVLNKLEYDKPKVAIVCPVETVNKRIESTVHAAMLTEMNKSNQITDCIVYGPLALDSIISKESAKIKGILNEVAGDADLLVAPNIDTGNVLYKAINFIANGTMAAIVTGAQVPVVLTSRADSKMSKLYSIALASCV